MAPKHKHMLGRQIFSSEITTKCRFCGCPVVDDCVSLSTVDAAKLSNWSVVRTGVPIAEESAAASWSCMNCVREAKRFFEINPLDDDCIWWNEIKDRYFNYYQVGWMKSCSVALSRLPEDQVKRLLDCLQENGIKQEAEEEEQEEEESDSMEADHSDSDSSVRKPKKKKKLSRKLSALSRLLAHQMACSHCNFVQRNEMPEQHIKTVSCKICSENFPCRGLLRCHEVECFFLCPQCPKRYKTIPKLDKHLNLNHKTKKGYWQSKQLVPWSHSCNLCKKGFPTAVKLLKHKKSCNKCYVCDTCGAKKFSKMQFLCHLHKEHNSFQSNKIWTCLKCDKKYLFEKSWRLHDAYHNRQERHEPLCQGPNYDFIQAPMSATKHRYLCQICGKNFNSEGAVDKHLYTYHNKGVLPVQCVHCKINIASLDMRRGHYCPTRPKVACSKCNLTMYEEYLFRHQIIVKCYKCDISFPCEYLFRQHLTERTYPCLACGKEYFCDISSLTKHVHSEHGQDKEVIVSWRGLDYSHLPFNCDKCKIYFETSNDLDKHIQNYHKNCPCEFCAKMFGNIKQIQNHLAYCHTPELYFRSKGLLNKLTEFLESGMEAALGPRASQAPRKRRKALRQIAPSTPLSSASSPAFSPMSSRGVSPAPREQSNVYCKVCQKKFTNLSCLPKHEEKCKKHPKIFPCGKCDQRFDSKTDLLNHFSSNHDLEGRLVHPCSMCSASYFSKSSLHDHKRSKHGSSSLVLCAKCGRKYKNTLAERHESVCHLSEKSRPKSKKINSSFTCSVCGWTSGKRRLLATHLWTEHKIGRFERKCLHCNKDFSGFWVKKAHVCANRLKVKCAHCSHTMFEDYLLEHTLEETCTKCGQTFPCEITFIRHVNERFFPCPECAQDFCNMDTLTKHAAEEHKRVEGLDVPWEGKNYSNKNLQCDGCRMFFSSKEMLQDHLDTYHGGAVCSMCALWMPSSAQQMEEHIKEKHVSLSPYFIKADSNQKAPVKRKVTLNTPLAAAAPNNGVGGLLLPGQAPQNKDNQKATQMKIFTLYLKEDGFVYEVKKELKKSSGNDFSCICGICLLCFPSKNELEEHFLSSHTSFKMYCSLCMSEFSNGTTYKLHMDTHHKNAKLPGLQGRTLTKKCDVCVFNFERKVVDQDHGPFSHLQQLQGGLFFKCLICDEIFEKTNVNLAFKHIKTEHVLESCVACAALMLEKHLKIHFSCSHSAPYLSLVDGPEVGIKPEVVEFL